MPNIYYQMSIPKSDVLKSIFLFWIYGKIPSSNAEAQGKKVGRRLIFICDLCCVQHCVVLCIYHLI